jgi:hypothetical protein
MNASNINDIPYGEQGPYLTAPPTRADIAKRLALRKPLNAQAKLPPLLTHRRRDKQAYDPDRQA